MMIERDEDGQPPERFYAARVAERAVSELIGLCKGMVCDGVITDGEAEGLRRWMRANPSDVGTYPANVLSRRLLLVFEDGKIDEEERQDLLTLLREVTGDTAEMDQPLNLATRLPIDDPPPALTFAGAEYVFTGRMLYGTRRGCEGAVTARGATVGSSVTKRTGVLVIGVLGSAAWKESTHGTKIIRALELKEAGHPIRIVDEDHWLTQLQTAR
jgi:NAD-dependent DNA ligase